MEYGKEAVPLLSSTRNCYCVRLCCTSAYTSLRTPRNAIIVWLWWKKMARHWMTRHDDDDVIIQYFELSERATRYREWKLYGQWYLNGKEVSHNTFLLSFVVRCLQAVLRIIIIRPSLYDDLLPDLPSQFVPWKISLLSNARRYQPTIKLFYILCARLPRYSHKAFNDQARIPYTIKRKCPALKTTLNILPFTIRNVIAYV